MASGKKIDIFGEPVVKIKLGQRRAAGQVVPAGEVVVLGGLFHQERLAGSEDVVPHRMYSIARRVQGSI